MNTNPMQKGCLPGGFCHINFTLRFMYDINRQNSITIVDNMAKAIFLLNIELFS